MTILEDLIEDVSGFAREDGRNETGIPGVAVYRATAPSTVFEPKFSTPVVALGLRGAKRLRIAGRTHRVAPSVVIVHSTNVPMECLVEKA